MTEEEALQHARQSIDRWRAGDITSEEALVAIGRALGVSGAAIAAALAADRAQEKTRPSDLTDRAWGYLQRAMEAERRAAGGSEDFRRHMLDVSIQWLDLARQVSLLKSRRRT